MWIVTKNNYEMLQADGEISQRSCNPALFDHDGAVERAVELTEQHQTPFAIAHYEQWLKKEARVERKEKKENKLLYKTSPCVYLPYVKTFKRQVKESWFRFTEFTTSHIIMKGVTIVGLLGTATYEIDAHIEGIVKPTGKLPGSLDKEEMGILYSEYKVVE